MKNLAKENCYLLLNSIRVKHGLNVYISTFKPFSGKSDKRVFNGLDYLFYGKTWKGVLIQLQAFAIGLDLKAKKSDKSVWSIVNDINNSSDLMQTKTIQSCRIVCNNTIKSILDEK